MKIGAIIQARVSSTRLPAKILKELPYGSGISVLAQVIKRIKKSKRLNEIIVATTTGKDDDKVVSIARKEDVKFFRGSEKDVLSRYYLAAQKNGIDLVVRITSDCPCIDVKIVDMIIDEHISEEVDYTSNFLDRTYPQGLDAEAVNFDVLEKAYKNAKKNYEREHVTPYIYENPQTFKVNRVNASERLFSPDIRITLDTEEDYALLCLVFDSLYYQNTDFDAYDIVNLFTAKPWLNLINKKVIQKKMFNTLEDELKEAVEILDLQDLKRARDFINDCLSK